MKKIRCLLLGGGLAVLAGFIGNTVHATVPAVVNTNMTVNTILDYCYSDCIIMPYCTLTIQNGGKVSFRGNITVSPHAALRVMNGTVLMYEDKRIILQAAGAMEPVFTQQIGGLLYAVNSTITAAKPPNFWNGIETMRSTVNAPVNFYETLRESTAYLENTTISFAKNAMSNYNSDFPPSQTYGGNIQATSSTFLNNLRSINAYGDLWANDPTNIGLISGFNPRLLYQFCNFTLTDDFIQPAGYNEMVYLNKCKGATFWSCKFTGNPYAFNNGKAAIRGLNSSIRAQAYVGNNSAAKTSFYNFSDGIVINNSLQSMYVPLIYRCEIACANAISLSGVQNAYIVENLIYNTIPHDYNGIFLRNCTGYRVEGNNIQYDGYAAYQMNGIVVANSGVANNTVYRNRFQSCKLDLQSIGTNKAAVIELTGLKFLCNNVAGNALNDHYEITVMQQQGNNNNGVHKYQYVEGSTAFLDRSAGNTFTQYENPLPAEFRNYYLDGNTNIIPSFRYKFYQNNTDEKPGLRNFPSAVGINMVNTCPVINTIGAKPAPAFSSFSKQLQQIEKGIGKLEGNIVASPDDESNLSYLYQQQSVLIDSMIYHYVENNLPDSILFTYQQVTKGYHYRILLAAAYAERNEYDRAIEILLRLPTDYVLNGEEKLQVENLSFIYKVVQQLYFGGDNWADLPPHYREMVYDVEDRDNMYAGAIARTLLATYEARVYKPFYVMPQSMSKMKELRKLNPKDKIYPNPASNTLYLDWNTNGSAVLIVTDVMGRLLLQQNISNGQNAISIAFLTKGMYFATVKEAGKVLYQQKIVKQ